MKYKSKFNLEKYGIIAFVLYEVILNLIVVFFSLIVSNNTELSFDKLFLGYFIGSVAITLGYYLIIIHANKIVYEIIEEKKAKVNTFVFLLLRYLVYLVLSLIAIYIFDVNLITLFIGLVSMRFVIYLDFFMNK